MSDSKTKLIASIVKTLDIVDDDGTLRPELFKSLIKKKPLTDEECRIISVDEGRYSGLIETREQALEFIREAAKRYGLTVVYLLKRGDAKIFVDTKRDTVQARRN